jgi:hypothetical protein
MWDLDSGERQASLSLDVGLTSRAVSRDACMVVSGDRMGRVHILRLEGTDAAL